MATEPKTMSIETGKVRIDPEKAGPSLAKRFMQLSMAEGPMGSSNLPKSNSPLLAVLSVALDMKSDEREYSLELLRSLHVSKSVDASALKNAIVGILDFEKGLPESQRNVTASFACAINEPSSKDAKEMLSTLTGMGLAAADLESFGFQSESARLSSALKSLLGDAQCSDRSMHLNVLQSVSPDDVPKQYADLLGKGELKPNSVIAYTSLLLELQSCGKAKETTPPVKAKDSSLSKKEKEPAKKPAHSNSVAILQEEKEGDTSLQLIKRRFCVPMREEGSDEPVVYLHHIQRAAAMLGIPGKKIPDFDTASRKELVNFTKMMIEAMPLSEKPARKKTVVESMINFTLPKTEGGATQDNPLAYIRRISTFVIYYGPEQAGKIVGAFKNVREKAVFRKVISKKHVVYPKSAEQLLLLSEGLNKLEIAKDSELYIILMERISGYSIRMDTAIARLKRVFETFGNRDAAISALTRSPSAILNTEKTLDVWLAKFAPIHA